MRFIYILPLGKRFIYNGDKQTEKWAVHNEVYIVFHWRNVLYIMEINKQRNGQFTTRFIFSLPLEKRFLYNGGKHTEMGSSQ